MMKITNNSQALQGVRVSGEVRWIKPGASLDADLSADEVKAVKAHDFMGVDGNANTDAPDYERDDLMSVDIEKPATSRDQLLVIAAYEGADVSDPERATKADLIKAIKAKRAA